MVLTGWQVVRWLFLLLHLGVSLSVHSCSKSLKLRSVQEPPREADGRLVH